MKTKPLNLGFLTALVPLPRAAAPVPGELATTFDLGTGGNALASAIVRQSDGKLVVGDEFTTFNGLDRRRVVRLNTDGSTDTDFATGCGAEGPVNGVALGPYSVLPANGGVVISGGFYGYSDLNRTRIARLHANGSLDLSFAPTEGLDGVVQAVAVQAAGKVRSVGGFTKVNGTARKRVARLNAVGSMDSSFATVTAAQAARYEVHVTTNLGGAWTLLGPATDS